LEKRRPDIEKMLAEWITPDRFFAMASLVRRNSLLRECSDESLIECVVQAAQMGLEIGGTRGHFYCVPYGKEAQGQPGWRGLAFLKLKAGAIVSLDTEVVFKGEVDAGKFKVSRSSEGARFFHEIDLLIPRAEGDAAASYALVTLPTGEIQFEVTSRDRVLRHRAHSKMPDGLLWNPKKFWEEGWRKTPFRIMEKRLPEGINKEAIERYGRAIEVDARQFGEIAEADQRIAQAEAANADLDNPPKQPRQPDVEVVVDRKSDDGPYDTARAGWDLGDRFVTDADLEKKWKSKGRKTSELSAFLYENFNKIEDLTELKKSQIPAFEEFVK